MTPETPNLDYLKEVSTGEINPSRFTVASLRMTQHGLRRLRERFGEHSKHQYRNHLLQAWSSQQSSPTVVMLRDQNETLYKRHFLYRLYQGFVFVFQFHCPSKALTLITCFKHQDPKSTLLDQEASQEYKQWLRG